MKNYVFDGNKLVYHPDRVNAFMEKGDSFPLYMEISPIGKCPHRCIFCAYDFLEYPDRKLETGRLLEFIGEIAESGIRSVLYAGEGEPLLHPDIDRFISSTRLKGIDAGLFTNGQLLGKELAEKILPFLTFIRFSFNGGTRENYSEIHRVKPSVFDTVLGNIENAAKIKQKDGLEIDLGAQYVLLPENINYLLNAVRQLKDAGIDYLAIKPFVQQSELQSYKMQYKLSPEKIDEVFSDAEKLSDEKFSVVARRESFSKYGEKKYIHCLGTSLISVLNSAGDIASCLPYWDKEDFVFGNIYQSSFKEIWCGERRMKIKNYIENELEAAVCPPNCRPNSINEFLWEIKHPSVKHVNFI
jgi:MoaA/NifB/PqqE/SkfB family radical SAM enzyme